MTRELDSSQHRPQTLAAYSAQTLSAKHVLDAASFILSACLILNLTNLQMYMCSRMDLRTTCARQGFLHSTVRKRGVNSQMCTYYCDCTAYYDYFDDYDNKLCTYLYTHTCDCCKDDSDSDEKWFATPSTTTTTTLLRIKV